MVDQDNIWFEYINVIQEGELIKVNISEFDDEKEIKKHCVVGRIHDGEIRFVNVPSLLQTETACPF